MKKHRKNKASVIMLPNNPVAKFARRFNKAHVFKDKSKYCRKAKHPGQEPFAIVLASTIAKGFNRKFVQRSILCQSHAHAAQPTRFTI